MSSRKQSGREIQMQFLGVSNVLGGEAGQAGVGAVRQRGVLCLMSATCNCSKLCQFKSEFEINFLRAGRRYHSIRFDSFQSSVRFGCVLFWCLTSWQASNNISFLRICRAGFSFDCDPIDLAIGISNRKIKLNRTERNRFFAHLAGRRFPLNWKRL